MFSNYREHQRSLSSEISSEMKVTVTSPPIVKAQSSTDLYHRRSTVNERQQNNRQSNIVRSQINSMRSHRYSVRSGNNSTLRNSTYIRSRPTSIRKLGSDRTSVISAIIGSRPSVMISGKRTLDAVREDAFEQLHHNSSLGQVASTLSASWLYKQICCSLRMMISGCSVWMSKRAASAPHWTGWDLEGPLFAIAEAYATKFIR